jgi:hypothetical protein
MQYKRDPSHSTQASEIATIRQINTKTTTSRNDLFDSDQSVILNPRWNRDDLESQVSLDDLSFSQPKPICRTPLMRSSNAPPPSTRVGATTTRRNHPESEKRLFTGTAASWWTVTSQIMTCCLWPVFYKKKGETRQAWREKVHFYID